MIKQSERFDIKRDIAIEKAGGIFCRACLTGRTDLSPDPRYCQKCYEFLAEEALQLPPGRHPKWLPEGVTPPQAPSTAMPVGGQNSVPYQNRVTENKAPKSNPRALKNRVLLSNKARGKLKP